MAELLRDLWEFIVAVGKPLIARITGGLLAVLLTLAYFFPELRIVKGVFFAFVAIYLFSSAYVAWKKEHLHALVAEERNRRQEEKIDSLIAEAKKPPAVKQPISKHNPGRTFNVLDHVGTWLKGQTFTEYEFRSKNAAPIPHPGQDPVVAMDDHYEEMLERLLNLKVIELQKNQ